YYGVSFNPYDPRDETVFAAVGGRSVVCEFEFDHCDIWFLRFGISPDYQQLATGNQIGQIFLWDLQEIPLLIDKYIDKKKSKNTGTNKKEKVTMKKKGNGSNGGNGKKSASGANTHTADSNGGSTSSDSGNHASDNLNPEKVERKECKPSVLGVESCDSTIRQIAFSKNRNWMVAVCDDATIWCWKMNREIQQAGNSRYDPMVIDD
ncbi:10298_t:CDS:2, partial [Racocetra fulgida]